MMKNQIAMFLTLTLLAMGLASPGLASDGVLEINQTCATQTGCFSGDVAGLPVTIDGTAGRSYRLTSDLIVPDENTDGIVVNSGYVGIDLNNFAILGVACVGAGSSHCRPGSGTGSGVWSTHSGISLKNGSIAGMGNYGVYLQNGQSELTNLRIRWNRTVGIWAGTGSTVSDNTVNGSGDTGILANRGSTVSGNSVYSNWGYGISASTGSVTVSGNSVYQNTLEGLYVGTGSTVSGNTVDGNGYNGISAGSGSTVTGNTVRGNGFYGLALAPDTGYSNNVTSGNTAGAVSGGVEIGQNLCDGNTTCP